MWKKIIFIFIVAASPAQASFLKVASLPIERCQAKHQISSIGGVPFAVLLDELKSVKWVVPGLLLSGSGGKRNSGVNYQDTQTAYINISVIQTAREAFVDGFLLHEGFGATNYDDDEAYDKSIAISFCAYSDSRELVRKVFEMVSPLQKRVKQNTYTIPDYQMADNRAGSGSGSGGGGRNNSQGGRAGGRGGSSTIVGGDGGDLQIFHLKLFLLLRFADWHQKKSRDTARMYAGMQKLLHMRVERAEAPIHSFIKDDPIDDFFFWDQENDFLRVNGIWPSNVIAQECSKILDQLERFLY